MRRSNALPMLQASRRFGKDAGGCGVQGFKDRVAGRGHDECSLIFSEPAHGSSGECALHGLEFTGEEMIGIRYEYELFWICGGGDDLLELSGGREIVAIAAEE